MLTCSVVASAASRLTTTSIRSQSLLPLHLPSAKPLLSLKQCVQNLTTQQRCFLVSSSTSLTPVLTKCCTARLYHPHHQQDSWKGGRSRSHRCSLNLNHHINFQYINSSIVTTIHHFHWSTSTAADSEAANGSITNNKASPAHDVGNDSTMMTELSSEDEIEESFEGHDYPNNHDDEEEALKERVWNTGPALLPTFNVGAYANESENVKKLIELGVDLSRWEGRYGTIPLLYKSNFEETMQPVIEFLRNAGVEDPGISRILTENPFIFNEDIRNLVKRLEYLRLKKFSPDAIINVITGNPYWLSFSVPRIDRRLGFFQTYFELTGDQVRKLASSGSSGPKLITYNLGRVKDVTFTIKEEMGFTGSEIVKILLARPRIWKEVPGVVRARFDYLHNEEKFSHADFVRCPFLLSTRERRMRARIEFLRKLRRAQFDPKKPNYISIEKLCIGNDAEFATKVAEVGVAEFNNFLKTL